MLFFQQAALEESLPTTLSNFIFEMYLFFLAFNLEQITNLNIDLQCEKPKFSILLSKMTTLMRNAMTYFIKINILNKTLPNNINIENPNNYKNIDDICFGGKFDALLKKGITKGKIANADLKSFKIRTLTFMLNL